MSTKVEDRDEFLQKTLVEKPDIDNDNSSVRLRMIEPKFAPILDNNNRINDVIEYETSPKDDGIITLMKMEINDAKLTMNDLYKSGLFRDVGQAYNLFYSLKKFNKISEGRLRLWATLLGKDLVISLSYPIEK